MASLTVLKLPLPSIVPLWVAERLRPPAIPFPPAHSDVPPAKTTMKTKTVDFAYPTSTVAGRFGYSDTGCYVVGVKASDEAKQRYKAAFATKKKAIEYGNTLAIPWHPLWVRHTPELQSLVPSLA